MNPRHVAPIVIALLSLFLLSTPMVAAKPARKAADYNNPR